MICGVDEAGRGPVLGPMVIAAVMIEDETPLKQMGVKDSKRLSRPVRTEISEKIRGIAKVATAVISSDDIDESRKTMSLNELEGIKFAELLNELGAERAYIDAADVDTARFERLIRGHLEHDIELICEHKADDRFPHVSAASIVAKASRDSIMDQIQQKFARPIGSGYASDSVTRDFLKDWIKENGDFPPHTRRSWATAKRISNLVMTKKITSWE